MPMHGYTAKPATHRPGFLWVKPIGKEIIVSIITVIATSMDNYNTYELHR